MPATIAQRYRLAFGGNDQEGLRELHDEDVQPYGPLATSRPATAGCRDGRIIEQWVGDNSFRMPSMDLVTYGMDLPRDTQRAKPPMIEASAA